MKIDRRARHGLVLAAGLAMVAGAAAGPVAGQGTWETTLQARDINGDGATDAYYDTVLNVTWLANANAGAGSAYDSSVRTTATDGRMNWKDATRWAADLNVHGITGWRLPTVIDTGTSGCDRGYTGTDCGWNVQAISADGQTVYSELAHLYYTTLGNLAACDAKGNCLAEDQLPQWVHLLSNTGPFINLQPDAYWFGVAYALSAENYAWHFSNRTGYQAYSYQDYDLLALAVRPGDVNAAAVPEPQTYALLLLGLSVITVAARRRRSA